MKSRIRWMDSVRGLAILIVILYHSTNGVWNAIGSIHPAFTTVSVALGPYRMPALFLLSGMLVERSLRKGVPRYISGKLRHVAWPYIVWCLLTELNRDGDFSKSDFFRDLGPFEPSLWFLWYLLAFYMFQLLVKRFNPAVLASVSIGLSMMLPEIGTLPRITYMYAFFALGILVARHLASVNRFIRKPHAIWMLIVPLLYVVWMDLSERNVRFEPLMAPWVLSGIFLMIWACAQAEKWAWFSKPLEYIGRNSIVFYVVQAPLISIITKLEVVQTIHRTVILVPAVFTITLMITIAISMLSNRFPLVHTLFVFPVTNPFKRNKTAAQLTK